MNVRTNVMSLIVVGPLSSCQICNNICEITNLSWRGSKIDLFIVQSVARVLLQSPLWELITARYVWFNFKVCTGWFNKSSKLKSNLSIKLNFYIKLHIMLLKCYVLNTIGKFYINLYLKVQLGKDKALLHTIGSVLKTRFLFRNRNIFESQICSI